MMVVAPQTQCLSISISRLPLFLVVVLAVTLPGPPRASGQEASLARFAKLELDATYPDGFAYLSGIRELSDGRVLVADPTSSVFVRVDFDGAVGDTLGRVGAGPQEYGQPDRVFPLPGDSTLLVDLGNGRFIVVDPEGEFVAWPTMYRANPQGRSRALQPTFVDGAGKLYGFSIEGSPPDDTTYIGRFDRDRGEEGIAARLWHPEFRSRRANGGRPMLVPFDGMAVGEDGRVAVVRANGYSVDWFLPDGRVVNGPEYEAESYPVGEAEKEAEIEVMMAEAVFATTQTGGGEASTSQLRRGVPSSARAGLGEFAWPEDLPTFRASGIHISPLKRVWVERVVPVEAEPFHEVFDGEGVRVGFVPLPKGGRLLGFGVGRGGGTVAYLARTDALGLKWLERYRVVFEGG